jgi:hypothetical protein
MIIHPDFLRHWKTRKLIAMTGDSGSPLVLLRLWSHCQTSRKWEFPELKRDDLAAVCEWESLKLSQTSCEKALVACRWIERLQGGGYRVRSWAEHNKSLISNWNRNPSGLPKVDSEGDPTGTPRGPRREPDQNRIVQNSPDLDKSSPVQADKPVAPVAPLEIFKSLRADLEVRGTDVVRGLGVGGTDGGTDGADAARGLASSIAQKLTAKCGAPTIHQVRNFLSSCFAGAVDYAEPFFAAMVKQGWADKSRRPISDWKAMAKSYASKAHMKKR